jgi:hypothetical protein
MSPHGFAVEDRNGTPAFAGVFFAPNHEVAAPPRSNGLICSADAWTQNSF